MVDRKIGIMTPEQIIGACCITIYDIDRYFLDDKTLKEMNNYLLQKKLKAYFDYPHIGGGAEAIFHELIVIGIDTINAIGVAALYDILKYSFNVISAKTKSLQKKPALFIEHNGESLKLDYGFDLTDEQKEKVVDAALKFILQKHDTQL